MAKSYKNKPSSEDLKKMEIRANRKGNREAEMENESGFISKAKVFKSKKAYSRKSLQLY